MTGFAEVNTRNKRGQRMVATVAEPEKPIVVVREFDVERDCPGAAAVERMCEVGSSGSGKISLFTDLLGDPLCRVRRSPAFLMLVAETGGAKREIVGLIRGCIKTVTCGKKTPRNGKPPTPLYTKLAYILGLRVSPSHRRMGIGLKLVTRIEEWFREEGAEYSYMATEKDNEASKQLFVGRCGYSKFRTPSILVQPVFAHRVRVPRRITVLQLPPDDAESLYRRRFSTVEFFPRDIDAVLNNPLSLGTFLAVANAAAPGDPEISCDTWAGSESFLADPPESWAVLSVWNCKDVFRLEVRGASRLKRGLATTSRLFDRAFPCLGVPSVPDLFRPFGLYFLYGVGGRLRTITDSPEILASPVRARGAIYRVKIRQKHGCFQQYAHLSYLQKEFHSPWRREGLRISPGELARPPDLSPLFASISLLPPFSHSLHEREASKLTASSAAVQSGEQLFHILVVSLGQEPPGEVNGGENAVVVGGALAGPLAAAAAVAGDEDGEAGLHLRLVAPSVAEEVGGVRLQPADGPVGVVGIGPREAPAAVRWHQDDVELPVHLPPSLLPALPLSTGPGRPHLGPLRLWVLDVVLQIPEAEVRRGVHGGTGGGGGLAVVVLAASRPPQPQGHTGESHSHLQRPNFDSNTTRR